MPSDDLPPSMDATTRRDGRTPAYATDGGEDEDEETPLQEAVAGVVVALTLLVGFTLLFLDVSFFWVAFPVGFGGLLPAAVALARWYESRHEREARGGEREREADDSVDEALATLRDRYARGVIDEAEFEARLDALLRTESLDDARADAERRAADERRERERAARESESERER